jgi:hypothetical protein
MKFLSRILLSVLVLAVFPVATLAQAPLGWRRDAFLFHEGARKEALAIPVNDRWDEDGNPYTKTFTPYKYPDWAWAVTPDPEAMPESDEPGAACAARLKRYGIGVAWRELPLNDLLLIEARVAKAAQLGELGVDVNWWNHPYWELEEWESRILVARQLEAKGEDTNWHDYTFWRMSKKLWKMSHSEDEDDD